MLLDFEKLHGLGNDFIIFDGRKSDIKNYNELAKQICDRHFGIGADGMMVVLDSNKASVKMNFYNADGSQARMCGNGIRCFCKFVYDNKIVNEKKFSVETLAGIMKPEIFTDSYDLVYKVCVNMGKINLDPKNIPMDTNKEQFINEDFMIDDFKFKLSVGAIGSIHAVIFVDDFNNLDIKDLGSKIEKHKIFKEGINVNFAKINSCDNIDVLTWERGVGQTLACGTGASTVSVLSSMINNTSKKTTINLLGGPVLIEEKEDQNVYMTGPAKRICKGIYYI
ncbi:MAG: diaminopimelate epimerase [Peptostreptococcaceae bacterium]|nr:diaminopimelate epimerase [Peptostreptococcaceae bacterium]